MKSKITDLRNHMFAALERLGEEGLSAEDLKREIARAQAIAEVGKVIVESAKVEVLYARVSNRIELSPTDFLEIKSNEPTKPIVDEHIIQFQRPKSEYSNPSFTNQ